MLAETCQEPERLPLLRIVADCPRVSDGANHSFMLGYWPPRVSVRFSHQTASLRAAADGCIQFQTLIRPGVSDSLVASTT